MRVAALISAMVFTGSAALAAPQGVDTPVFTGVVTWVEPHDSKLVAQFVTVTWVSSGEAPVVWPGNLALMRKVHMDPNLVLLQKVAADGSMTTLYLEVKNKRFLLLDVGAQTVPSRGGQLRLTTFRGQLRL